MPDITSLELDHQCPRHAIATILAEIEHDDLERLAVDIIREQRARVAKAQELYDRLGNFGEEGSDADSLERRRHEYRLAVIMVKANHSVTAEIIDHLGYVPPIPEDMTRQ